ncbi:MAG: cation diffusion facilitator family transporter [Thermodesulfobacteriota bacterium]|nr:cation diffusion facilitator family transporter [Thermodesulfobacteriota bacterium]
MVNALEEKDDKIDKLKKGQRVAFLATTIAFLVAIMKASIGYLFESDVLIADALHSSADLLSNFAAGFGLWLASRKKSPRFPYGLYKAETLACFIVGGFIIFAGIEILHEGLGKLLRIEPVQALPILPVSASIVSSIAAFFVARKQRRVGRLIGSQSLIANSREAFLDIFTSLIVLVGILMAYAAIPYVEGVIIILIALLILKLGIQNVWISLMILMDANLDSELQIEIGKGVSSIYGVKGVNEVKIRQSGPFKMVECIISARPLISLYRAHELADRVEEFISENYNHIESVFIRVEPMREEVVSAIIPVKNIDGLESRMHGHFGRAPYFAILKLSNNQADVEDFYYNEFLNEKKHIGVKLVRVIVRYKIDILFTASIGEITFHMLKDNLVEIYKGKEDLCIKEVIQSYRLNELQNLTSPTHSVEDSQVGRQF